MSNDTTTPSHTLRADSANTSTEALTSHLLMGADMDTATVDKVYSYLHSAICSMPATLLTEIFGNDCGRDFSNDFNNNISKHTDPILADKSMRQGSISKFIDGTGMACPMPLLKTKVALRDLADDKALYVIATDPHSQADISAFCQQTGYTLLLNTVSTLDKDTIFHFIITKTDSN